LIGDQDRNVTSSHPLQPREMSPGLLEPRLGYGSWSLSRLVAYSTLQVYRRHPVCLQTPAYLPDTCSVWEMPGCIVDTSRCIGDAGASRSHQVVSLIHQVSAIHPICLSTEIRRGVSQTPLRRLGSSRHPRPSVSQTPRAPEIH
jgi:hypothetical protein